jgi:hypothetical protein
MRSVRLKVQAMREEGKREQATKKKVKRVHVPSQSSLDPMRHLSQGELKGVEAEWLCSQHHFLLFQEDFSRKFLVIMDEMEVSPWDNLFDPLLLLLLVTVFKYKQLTENEFDERFSFKALYNGCMKYLCIHNSCLAMAFEEDVKKDKEFF